MSSTESGQTQPSPELALWLEGRAGIAAVPAEALAELAPEALVDALRGKRVRFASRAEVERLRGVRRLSAGDSLLALLEEILQLPKDARDALLVAWLFRRLGEEKHSAAVPRAAAVWKDADSRHRTDAGRALVAIGGRAAEDAIQAAVSPSLTEVAEKAAAALRVRGVTDLSPRELGELKAPVQALIEIGPASAVDRLGHCFTPEAIATPAGINVACNILIALFKNPGFLTADRRWADVAADLTRHAALGKIAKDMLGKLPKDVAEAALERARGGAPKRAAPVGHRWLERYRAGEHAAVWKELQALGNGVRTRGTLSDAEAVARETMDRVRTNLERIVARLEKVGYEFAAGDAALLPPNDDVARTILALEELLGRSLPLSLKAFYEVVGSVDLTEGEAHYPDGEAIFALVGRGDPLVIVSAEGALSIARELKTAGALDEDDPAVYLGPDPDRKADPDRQVEDADPYELLPRSGGADDVVCQGTREALFVDLLRESLRWGGFPDITGEDDDPARDRAGLSDDLLPF